MPKDNDLFLKYHKETTAQRIKLLAKSFIVTKCQNQILNPQLSHYPIPNLEVAAICKKIEHKTVQTFCYSDVAIHRQVIDSFKAVSDTCYQKPQLTILIKSRR